MVSELQEQAGPCTTQHLQLGEVAEMVLSQAPIPRTVPNSFISLRGEERVCSLCTRVCSCAHTQRLERTSIALHFTPLRQGLSSNLGLCWCPAGPWFSSVYECTWSHASLMCGHAQQWELVFELLVFPARTLHTEPSLQPLPWIFLPKAVSHFS